MSTRGIFIIRKDNVEKGLYIPHDAYPEDAGMDVVDLIQTTDLSALFDCITEYDEWDIPEEDDHPDVPDFFDYKQCKMAAGRSKRLWAQRDTKDFIRDSRSCEYGYVVDLDNRQLEYYVGFQQEPQEGNPYGTQYQGQYSKKYYPCRLVAVFTMSYLTIVDIGQVVEEMRHSNESTDIIFYKWPEGGFSISREGFSELMTSCSAKLLDAEKAIEKIRASLSKLNPVHERRARLIVSDCDAIGDAIFELQERIEVCKKCEKEGR